MRRLEPSVREGRYALPRLQDRKCRSIGRTHQTVWGCPVTANTHTPGPWYVDDSGLCPVITALVPLHGIPEETDIARLSSEPRIKDSAGANARLIAAAPHLLAALEAAVRTLKVANIAGKSLFATDVTRQAEAAIAKAQGGAQ